MASLVFYSWGEPRYVVLVVLSILLNYGFGLALDGCGERKGLKKAVYVLSILVNLGLLGYFKYFNFFLELAMSLLGRQGFAPRDIALPIGISFYTFQSISYLADTFRGGESRPEKCIPSGAVHLFVSPDTFRSHCQVS